VVAQDNNQSVAAISYQSNSKETIKSKEILNGMNNQLSSKLNIEKRKGRHTNRNQMLVMNVGNRKELQLMMMMWRMNFTF
jgi:hypothetical protein